jgi:hypothetical protein
MVFPPCTCDKPQLVGRYHKKSTSVDETIQAISFQIFSRPSRSKHREIARSQVIPPTRIRRNKPMASISRRVPFREISMINLITAFTLAIILFIENVHAFSSRHLHPPSTTRIAQTRYSADSTSLPKAIGKSNVVAVTDANYRNLFGGEKVLLLDAFAHW